MSERSSLSEKFHLLAEELPWKHVGYKIFSRWVASDQAFFIVRRFGALNARVVLSLQDEIVELEEQLDAMDEHASNLPDDTVHNGSFRVDPLDARKKLVRDTLPEKLAKYST